MHRAEELSQNLKLDFGLHVVITGTLSSAHSLDSSRRDHCRLRSALHSVSLL